MFGLDFSLAQAMNVAIGVLIGGALSTILAWFAMRSGRRDMRRSARAFGVITRHLHQAFRDPNSVGLLNLDDDDFPVGLTHLAFAKSGLKQGDDADDDLDEKVQIEEEIVVVLKQPKEEDEEQEET